MSWDPTQYLTFAAPRMQPAIDLLARIDGPARKRVVDLGCGPGNVTQLLRKRWPAARMTGIDTSAEMLARAPENCPETTWRQQDIATWRPDTPPDLIYSNAALQWVPDHETLLPRLLGLLAPGGVLAVQMPFAFQSPWNRAIVETARQDPWSDAVPPLTLDRAVETPETYFGILASHTADLSIWQTEYLHLLEGADPVLEWIRGAALRPALAALSEDQRPDFEAACAEKLRQAYPKRDDGITLFPFKRLFLLARR